MSLGIYFYIVSIIIFAGGACLIEITILRRELRPYRRLLFVMILVSFAITVILEPPAIAWSAWVYNYQYMFDIHVLGAEIETFLYTILVITAISMNAYVCASDEDNGRSILRMRWKRMKEVFKK